MSDISQQLKKIKVQQIALLKRRQNYIENNKMYFIGKPGGYIFNPIQADIIKAFENYYLKVFGMFGANRIGKTWESTVIAFSTLFGEWLWNGFKLWFPHNKPRRVRYVGQEWEEHVKTVIIPTFKELWPKSRKLKTKKNNQGIEATWIDVETGSELQIMTNCQDPMHHEGWEGDLVVYDEPTSRKHRIANSRGLIDRQGREFFAATLLGEEWMDREIIKGRLEDGSIDDTIFTRTGEIDVNIGYGITQKGVDDFAKKLRPEEKRARLLGIPSYMSQLICPEFRRDIHAVDRFDVPLDWPIDIAFDIHPTKEQAVLFVATSPQNVKYAVFELFEHGDGKRLAEHVIRIVNRYSLRVKNIIIDPLAKGDKNSDPKALTTFDKIDRVLARYGYYLDVATKDKESGILEINNRLMGPNKQPSLFFFKDLTRTIMEVEGWMTDTKTGKPKKENDDMMENLYRILILGSEYEDMDEDEDEDYESSESGRSTTTGY